MSAGLLQVPLVLLFWPLAPLRRGFSLAENKPAAYQHCLRSIVDTCRVAL